MGGPETSSLPDKLLEQTGDELPGSIGGRAGRKRQKRKGGFKLKQA
jgi:hypothetical protein